jgi:anhydro-N-acetylmuramic acid kinase
MALNYLAGTQGLQYDKDGSIARTGNTDHNLLAQMNALPFYGTPPPKSLGAEWFEQHFKPLLAASLTKNIPAKDLLATTAEHIAIQVAKATDEGTMLVTGGGALNTHLMERIKAHTSTQTVKASHLLINYKEALIFAFLGVLRTLKRPNALASATGAKKDTIGGCIFLP